MSSQASECQQTRMLWHVSLNPITRNKPQKNMEIEKLKKKLAAHVSRNMENVLSGLVCASGSAASSLHASSSYTFAHLGSHHKIVFLHLRYFWRTNLLTLRSSAWVLWEELPKGLSGRGDEKRSTNKIAIPLSQCLLNTLTYQMENLTG